MFTTAGALGTRSSANSFDGGTAVTPYGTHSAWHAGATSSMLVVTVTPEHGPVAVAVADGFASIPDVAWTAGAFGA
jgi:hypothetical protein